MCPLGGGSVRSTWMESRRHTHTRTKVKRRKRSLVCRSTRLALCFSLLLCAVTWGGESVKSQCVSLILDCGARGAWLPLPFAPPVLPALFACLPSLHAHAQRPGPCLPCPRLAPLSRLHGRPQRRLSPPRPSPQKPGKGERGKGKKTGPRGESTRHYIVLSGAATMTRQTEKRGEETGCPTTRRPAGPPANQPRPRRAPCPLPSLHRQRQQRRPGPKHPMHPIQSSGGTARHGTAARHPTSLPPLILVFVGGEWMGREGA